jgi:hypothetical protein
LGGGVLGKTEEKGSICFEAIGNEAMLRAF